MFGGFVQHLARRRQEEERFYKIFHTSSSMMSISSWDDGRFVDVNQTFLASTGYEMNEVMGRTASELNILGAEELAKFTQLAKNQGSFRNFEGTYRTRNGEVRHASYSVETLVLGERKHLLVSASHTTEDRRGGEKSREREGRFKTLFEAIRDGVFLLDREGRFTFVNDRIAAATRLAEEWFIGRHYLDTVRPEDRGQARKAVDAVLAGREEALFEFRHHPPSTDEMWLEVSITSLRGKGDMDGALGTVRNITGRKRADKESTKNRLYLKKMATDHAAELKKIEERYRDLVDNGVAGVFQTNLKGHVFFANETFDRMLGFNVHKEAQQRDALSVYRKGADRKKLIQALSRTGRIRGYEVELVSVNGQVVTVLVDAALKGDMVSGVAIDITEQKRAEGLLKESEGRYRNLIENAPLPVIISRVRDSTILHANALAVKLLKAPANGGVGESFADYYESPVKRDEFARLLKDDIFGKEQPVCLRDAYGGRVYVHLSSVPLEFNGEEAILTALSDVTGDKYSVDRLAANEAKYRATFDNAGAALLLCKKYVITDCNTKALTLFNCSREQLIGQPLFRLYDPEQPDGGDSVETVFHKIRTILSGDAQSFEWRWRRLYGTPFEAEAGFSLIKINNEDILQVVVRDITERKQVENRLRVSEETYRSIFENAMEGIFQVTVQGRFLTANPALAKMTGYDSPEDLIGSVTDIGAQVYANSAERARFIRLLEEYDYVDGFEVELCNKNHEKVWATINARAVRGKNNRILYIEGTAVDVTRRKLAEKALMDSETKYRNLVENSVLAIAQTSLQGEIAYLNDSFVRLLDLDSQDKLTGTNILEFCRNPEVLQNILKRIQFTEVAKNVELNFVTGGGRAVNMTGTLACHGSLITWIVMESESQKRMAGELQEVTTALRVLLDQRAKDRQEIEEKIMLNVKELVLPHVEGLMKARLTDHHKALVQAIAKNLDDLTSPFLKNMYKVYTRFTPTEVRVATLIRDGKTAKEIASILGVSESAVNLHRQHIRNKLGIKNEKENLRSRLLSLTY